MPTSPLHLRLGTRASALAQWQADWVTARLLKQGVQVERVLVTTQGDVQTGPLDQIGGQGLFTREIQRALLDGRIDLAVHSLKDLPTEQVKGLTLGAIPQRGPTGDILVSRVKPNAASNTNVTPLTMETLPQGAIVGTGSMRRSSQLLHARADLDIRDIRGNVETRLRKLDEGQYDAIILAEAGLRRLGFEKRIQTILSTSVMLPAIGQGALGLEVRANDQTTLQAIAPLNHLPTQAAVTAERTMLAMLQGGCLAPIAAWGRVIHDGLLQLDGVVLSRDGSQRIAATATTTAKASLDNAAELGQQVAQQLLNQNAAQLIAAARND